MDGLRRQRLAVVGGPEQPVASRGGVRAPGVVKSAVAFVGSPRPTKAHLLVDEIVAALRDRHAIAVRVLDLAHAGAGLCTLSRSALDPASAAMVDALEGCDGLIIGCPVFQGSYPGLFKHVFDLVRPTALRNKPVLLSAVGGGLRHSLVVEHQLRPLFGFFEASTISTAVYACAEELAPGTVLPDLLRARIVNAADQFAAQFNNPILSAAGQGSRP
jgi:FMN reductase